MDVEVGDGGFGGEGRDEGGVLEGLTAGLLVLPAALPVVALASGRAVRYNPAKLEAPTAVAERPRLDLGGCEGGERRGQLSLTKPGAQRKRTSLVASSAALDVRIKRVDLG